MTRARAKELAAMHGARLPTFGDAKEARTALFDERNDRLARLRALARAAGVVLDGSPESLRPLEAWYLDLHRRRGWDRAGTSRAEVEDGLAYYLGVVAKRAMPGARWVVEPYALGPAGRWEIGVAVKRHIVMLRGSCRNWFRETRAGRDDALLRRLRATWTLEPARKAATKRPAPASDGSIDAAIETQLAMRSTPALPLGEIWVRVRHRLRDPRILLGRVRVAADALVASGRLVVLPGKKPRYALA